MTVTDFREQCLHLLDEVPADGITLTKRGKELARVVPVGAACGDLIGSLKGWLRVSGDLLSTGEKWDADE